MKWIQFLSFFLKYLFSKYIDIYDLSMIEPPLGVHFDRTAYIYICIYRHVYIYIYIVFFGFIEFSGLSTSIEVRLLVSLTSLQF